jgi:hypothetical protein
VAARARVANRQRETTRTILAKISEQCAINILYNQAYLPDWSFTASASNMASEDFGFDAEEFEKNATMTAGLLLLLATCFGPICCVNFSP